MGRRHTHGTVHTLAFGGRVGANERARTGRGRVHGVGIDGLLAAQSPQLLLQLSVSGLGL